MELTVSPQYPGSSVAQKRVKNGTDGTAQHDSKTLQVLKRDADTAKSLEMQRMIVMRHAMQFVPASLQVGDAKYYEVSDDERLLGGGPLDRLLAKSNILNYLSIENGIPKWDLTHMTFEDAAAIKELSFDKEGHFKIILHDKKNALTDLGKHLGGFTSNITIESESLEALLKSSFDRPKGKVE